MAGNQTKYSLNNSVRMQFFRDKEHLKRKGAGMLLECKKCNKRFKAKSWILKPNGPYYKVIMHFVKSCRCKTRDSILLLERFRFDSKTGKTFYSTYPACGPMYGPKAWDFYLAHKNQIIEEYKPLPSGQGGPGGLDYWEYDRVKTNYSTLSALKIGRMKPNFDDVADFERLWSRVCETDERTAMCKP